MRHTCGTDEFRGADRSLDTCPCIVRRIELDAKNDLVPQDSLTDEREQMFQNDYGTTLEQWKVDLILTRARRLGVRRHDLEDAQQQVVLEILGFTFDPVNANGATEVTALTALIDNKLKAIQRAKARYARRVNLHAGEFSDEMPSLVMDDEITTVAAQAMDVRNAVTDLPPEAQLICRALAEGRSVNDIARSLGVGWYTIKRQVQGIRAYFEYLGLDGWVLA